MRNLTHYEVGNSALSGAIPAELFSLSTLEVLHLQNATFSGTLSDSDFVKLKSLRELWLNNNDFSGEIPLDSIENIEKLQEVKLQGNSLTGSVPSSFCSSGVRGYGKGELSVFEVDCTAVECTCCDCAEA
jgi:hypothetical protein